MTPEQVLGIDPGSDPETIRRAYRKAAQSAHPDKGGNEDAFHLVKEAYEELMGDATEADKRLQGLLQSLLEGRGALPSDLVRSLETSVRGAIELSRTELEALDGQQKRLDVIKERLGRPDGDPIDEMMEETLVRFEAKRGKLNREITINTEVLSMLSRYWDKQPGGVKANHWKVEAM